MNLCNGNDATGAFLPDWDIDLKVLAADVPDSVLKCVQVGIFCRNVSGL
jgi:hypothetical protein